MSLSDQATTSDSMATDSGGGNFIAKAIKRPGQLHRDLGVPQGSKIPVSRIRSAAKGGGKTAQRARFAMTLRSISKP